MSFMFNPFPYDDPNAINRIDAKGIKIPIYFSPIRGVDSYQLSFYKAGKRNRERVASLEAARTRAKELIEELADGQQYDYLFLRQP